MKPAIVAAFCLFPSLARAADYFGKRIYELRAPFDGELLYILGTPPVSPGGPLAFVAAPSTGPGHERER